MNVGDRVELAHRAWRGDRSGPLLRGTVTHITSISPRFTVNIRVQLSADGLDFVWVSLRDARILDPVEALAELTEAGRNL